MVNKRYEWAFEVAGPAASYARPDAGSSPISSAVPTRSAIIGMMTCVAFSREAYFWPERIELCAPPMYHRYTQNYNGPLRKSQAPFQIMATVLINVDYKIYGTVKGYAPPTALHNPMHQLRDVFMRRLKSGLFYRTPSLGLSEFIPSYFGPLRDDTQVDRTINLEIPSLLDTMFDRPTDGQLSPTFMQNVKIVEGVLHFAE
nr:CRISPR-associated protein Cas5 [Enterocloster asparagiformis]